MSEYESFPPAYGDFDGDTALSKLKRFLTGAATGASGSSSNNNSQAAPSVDERASDRSRSRDPALSHRSSNSVDSKSVKSASRPAVTALSIPQTSTTATTTAPAAASTSDPACRPTKVSVVSPTVRVSTANAKPRDIVRSSSSRSLAHDYRIGGGGISLSSPIATEGISSLAQFASIPGFPLSSDDLDDTRSVRSVSTLSRPSPSAAEVFRRLRGEGLSRDYWMKDEDAFNCFDCESVFTTFRRKHHCRLCGQIFCSRCASHLISSSRFGQQGFVRVCNLCLSMLKHSNNNEREVDQRNRMRESANMRISAPLEASMRPTQPTVPSSFWPRSGTPFTNRSDEALANDGDDDSRPETPLLHDDMDSPWPARRFSSPFIPQMGNESENVTSAAPFRERIAAIDEERPSSSGNGLGISVPPRADEIQDHPDVPPPTPLDAKAPPVAPTTAPPKSSPSESSHGVEINVQRSEGELDLTRHSTRESAGASTSSISVGPPAAELKRRLSHAIGDSPTLQASLQAYRVNEHKSAMLRQMLEQARVSRAQVWHRELLRLLDEVERHPPPNSDVGDKMDVTDYIRIKKIPGGRPSDSEYVSGAVFTKNVLHKRMPRFISHPRIVLVTFPLEYQRSEGQLQSLEPIRLQEDAYLSVLVQRVVDLKPDIVLAQKNVSSVALKKLMDAGITVARYVKPEVIQFVARLTDARPMQIETHIPAWAGRCASFRIQTFQHSHIPGERKTLLRFEGCANGLGCTIILRGAEIEELAKVKAIFTFMCRVSYSIRLEKAVIYDEQLRVTSHDHNAHQPAAEHSDEALISSAVQPYRRTVLAGSPFVQFTAPHVLEQMTRDEHSLRQAKMLRDAHEAEQIRADEQPEEGESESAKDEKKPLALQDPDDVAHESAFEVAEQRFQDHFKQWQSYLQGQHDSFRPEDHQKLYVLETVVCRATSRICVPPRIRSFSFYGDGDETLGSYIERVCRDNTVICESKDCTHQRSVHYRRYVHGTLCITIELYQMPDRKIDSDAIGFAIVCPLCDPDPPARVVSAETQSSSFARYLEHCFYPRSFELPCQHAVEAAYREFYRGFFAIRFSVHSIPVQTAAGPPNHIKIKNEAKIALRNDEYRAVLNRNNRFWDSVKTRVTAVQPEMGISENVEECRALIQDLVVRCDRDKAAVTAALDRAYLDAKDSNTLDLMDARRLLQNKAVEWESHWTALEQKLFGPGVQDIRRMTTAQLKRLFSDGTASSVSPERKSIRSEAENSVAEESPVDEKTPTATTAEHPLALESAENQAPESAQTKPADAALASDDPPGRAKIAVSKSSARLFESSDHESDSTICADGPQSMSPYLTRRPSREYAQTESEAEHPGPSRSKSSSAVTSLVNMFDKNVSAQNSPSSTSARPPLRRGATDRPRQSKVRSTADLLSDDNRYSTFVSPATHKRVEPQIRPSRIPARRVESAPGKTSQTEEVMIVPKRGKEPRKSVPKVWKTGETSTTGEAGPSTKRPPLTSRDSSRSTLKAKANHSQPGVTEGDKDKSTRSDSLGRRNVSSALKPNAVRQRQIPSTSRGQKVSAIASHFNRISHEAELERQKRMALSRARRIRPVLEARMTIQVYDNVKDAVKEDWYDKENESSDGADDEFDDDNDVEEADEEAQKASQPVEDTRSKEPIGASSDERENKQEVQLPLPSSTIDILLHHPSSRAIVGTTDKESSEAKSYNSKESSIMTPSSMFPDAFTLPRMSEGESSGPEKGSIMRALSNMWNYRNIDLPPVDYPLLATEHLFADNPILVREDEPSSIVAFSLSSKPYRERIRSVEGENASNDRAETLAPDDSSRHDQSVWSAMDLNADQTDAEETMRKSEGRHLLLQFEEGSSNFYCKVFFAEQFDALRRNCGCSNQFIESMSRCVKWESSGGKSKVKFLKTKDDRFIVKELSRLELDALLRFAPAYFEYVSKALFHGLPTILAKIFGFFRLGLRNPATGHTYRLDVLVTENLFYDRQLTQVFDLKGSTRNRRVTVSTARPNEVLMDENLIDMSLHNPLYVRESAKAFIQRATHNDSLFLSNLSAFYHSYGTRMTRQAYLFEGTDVMDYSLVVGVDAKTQELVIGIVDFIRTYTWDKKLESWVKDSAFLGGGSSKPGGPTIVTPKQYKVRFREAMEGYFLVVPDAWFAPSSCTIKDTDRFVPLIDGPPTKQQKDDVQDNKKGNRPAQAR